MPTISNWAFAALATGLVTATVIDIQTRRIPNAITAAMAGAGFGLALAGIGGVSIGAAAAGLLLGLALMLPGHALGATAPYAALAAVTAGLAVLVALRRRRLRETMAGTARMIATPSGAPAEIKAATMSSRFAYGPAIAIGSIVAAIFG